MKRTFVGVCDEEIPLSNSTTWQLNKLGGYPDWMYSDCNYPPCNVCGDPLYHVAQMYCPLEASSYHRTLYIFTCVTKSCINKKESWRVFRSQLLLSHIASSKQVTKKSPKVVAMVMDEWCEDADDWGSEPEEEIHNEHVKSSASNDAQDKGGTKPSIRCHPSGDAVAMAMDEWCEDADDWGSKSKKESHNEQIIPSASNGAHDRGGAKPSLECHPSGDAVPMVTRLLQDSTSNDEILTRATAKLAGQDLDEDTVKEQSEDVDPSDAMTRLSISTPSTQQTSKDSNSVLSRSRHHAFTGYFVNVFDEPSPCTSVTELTNHERELIADYQQREGVDLLEWQEEHLQMMSKVSSCEESYEKTSAKHGDKVFQRFAKRLQLCPEQCIRYSWNGTPLYLTSPSEGTLIPSCPHCGSQRVFEVQLMPQLINALHDADQPGIQIEFGVVIIYTCKANCWDDPCQPGQLNLREEYVEFQVDPDSTLIAKSKFEY
ncbi:programmed cell death protein 2-like [Patiria miniata]|uniref:Programmed cell death protein 2 C-terminal domain-containing protein n=1 Tax=Patiria miniata TaxID=46514 RepID=A0A913ZN34_PATMI|nr:programmed cell death protein 2-like [Patiria miniata]